MFMEANGENVESAEDNKKSFVDKILVKVIIKNFVFK